MSNTDDLESARRDFSRKIFLENEANADPWIQFKAWLKEAKEEKLMDYNAFNLGTVDNHGFPQARIVLLRDTSDFGLTFYSNYNSAKAADISNSNKVCANFYWAPLERQIRVSGVVEKVSSEVSDEYFSSRPRESQLAAWASVQSSVIQNREQLEASLEKYKAQFADQDVPRPERWGGYKIRPRYFEFWQGRPYRLHDRIVYRLDADFEWFMERLAP
ncbi:MAG: pyridoxamine 5'-phosphate oxidase [Flavobacteriales bacterium]|jgi:pyridoxamine 5'-phosphate oxidase